MTALQPWHKRMLTATALSAVVVAAFAWGEQQGWPWLVKPVSHAVSQVIGREIVIDSAAAGARIHLWQGVELQAPHLQIAGPSWGKTPWILDVWNGHLKMGYAALWQTYRGQGVHLTALTAERMHAWLERDARGRANWQFGTQDAQARAANSDPLQAIRIDRLAVTQGWIAHDDAALALNMQISFSLVQVPELHAQGESTWQAAALAKGHYKGLPVSLSARSTQPWHLPSGNGSPTAPWPVALQGQIGRAHVGFQGSLGQALWQGPVAGSFKLSGPSLAAVGQAVGVILPTTAAFEMQGHVQLDGPIAKYEVQEARVGDSRLSGTFVHHHGQTPSLLTGQLKGTRLAMADLGPAVGLPVSAQGERLHKTSGKVLPDKRFNLPSLKAMDADVQADIDLLDTGSSALQAMTDLKGRILLKGGLLKLESVSTKLAQGTVKGLLSLDARSPDQGLFHADLNVDDVRIERWVKPLQRANKPPYASGLVSGHLDVTGKGNSTADLLGSLAGQGEFHLRQGHVSHLAVELAGLDVMQGLFEFIKGDDSLPIACARMVWTAKNGVLKPRPFVISTSDSTVWVDGDISIKDETLDLRARVAPKDFSLLTLRTPILLKGSWRSPDVQVVNPCTWLRLLGAASLAAINPIAGALPLIDLGQRDAAKQADAMCRNTRKSDVTDMPRAPV